MAKQKNTPTSNAAAGTPAAGAESTSTTKARKATNPDETIYWNGARDKALIGLIRQFPGQLTTTRIAAELAKDPSFANEVHLLATESAPEKIRQRVKKLSIAAAKRGYPALELQRKSNSGYDYKDTLDEIFGGHGAGTQAPVPAAPVAADTSAPANVAPLAGGLIPVPTSAG